MEVSLGVLRVFKACSNSSRRIDITTSWLESWGLEVEL